MKFVTTATQSRNIDSYLINEKNIPGLILMENAAFGVTHEVMKHDGNVLVVCGRGNNGGDGFAVLRQLAMHGKKAIAILLGDPNKICGDAAVNYCASKNLGLTIIEVNRAEEIENLLYHNNIKIIVDAMFGTGLARELGGIYKDAVETINAYPALKIAVDIPSGINSDSGKICGAAIKADITVTFQTAKRGQLLYPGREYCGKLKFAPIGICSTYTDEYFLENSDIMEMLPERKADSHKGTYGKLLIIAGSDEYAGACIMSSLAALRSGVGMVKVISTKRVTDELLRCAPEIMSYTVTDWNDIDIQPHIKWCDAIAIGMGLGIHNGLDRIIDSVIESGKKTLIDADAINILAQKPELLKKLHSNCVLTPHMGEFSRLCGRSIDQIKENAVECAKAFAAEFDTNILLKNATSIIANQNGTTCYNLTGNSGLAKGGSGDTLSGLISSLMSQGMQPYSAACAGAYIQGKVAEESGYNEKTVTATDISYLFSKYFAEKQH